MARRPTNPRELPDALREAVDRTVQATLGSAERSRDRTQGAIDELVDTVDQLKRGAGAGIARSRRVVTGAIEERRPATHDDLKELKAELRAIGRRLDLIEERLPEKRSTRSGSTKGSASAKRGSSGGGSTKGSASAKRGSSGGGSTKGSASAKRGSSGGGSTKESAAGAGAKRSSKAGSTKRRSSGAS
jgi:hypothetical protein